MNTCFVFVINVSFLFLFCKTEIFLTCFFVLRFVIVLMLFFLYIYCKILSCMQ